VIVAAYAIQNSSVGVSGVPEVNTKMTFELRTQPAPHFTTQ